MTAAAIDVLNVAPRPPAERPQRPGGDRAFDRALDRAEKPDEAERPAASGAAASPADASAARNVETPAGALAASVLAALKAPTEGGQPGFEPISSPNVAAAPVADPDAEASPTVPGAASPAGSPEGEGPGEAHARWNAAAAHVEAAPIERRAEAGAEPEPDVSAWAPPGMLKAGGAGAKVGAATPADPQAGFAEAERLAAVKVLREAAGETSPTDAKRAPVAPVAPPPSNVAAAASPTDAAAAASFEHKLQAADGPSHAQSAPARPSAVPPAPATQVAIQLVRAVEDGARRLEVRLSPAELGRVEVKLEVAQDGRALAVVAADRQETLDLLQRDARSLERALQEAGIQADSGSLSFTLRQQARQAWDDAGHAAARWGSVDREPDAAVAVEAAIRPVVNLRALDISV